METQNNNTVSIAIRYNLTETGRADALRKGAKPITEQYAKGTISQEEANYIAAHAFITATGEAEVNRKLDVYCANPSEVIAVMQKRDAEEAEKKKAEYEQEIAKILETGPESVLDSYRDRFCDECRGYHATYRVETRNSQGRPWLVDNRLDVLFARAEKLAEQKNAESAKAKEECEKKASDRRAAKIIKEAEEKGRRIVEENNRNAFFSVNWPDEDKDRLAEGLVTEDELKQFVRDALFAPLADFERYAKLTGRDLPCDCGESANFEAEEAEHLTKERYATARKIKAVVSKMQKAETGLEFEVSYREHIATCAVCGERKRRYGALVSVAWNGWQLSREYAI